MDQNLSVPEIVEKLGGTKTAAKFLGKSPQAVSNWKARGKFPAQVILDNRKLFEKLSRQRAS